MKHFMYVAILALGALFVAPQHSDAQFLKQLGKAAEKIGKKVLQDATADSQAGADGSSQTSQTESKAATTSSGSNAQKRKVHLTSATKTITVRDGAQYCGPFNCGVACIRTTKNWFVIDKEGNKLFTLPDGHRPASVDEYGNGTAWFDNDRLMVIESLSLTRMNAYIYDTKGNVVKTFKEIWAASPFTDGLAILQIPKGFNWEAQYIDANGNTVACSVPGYKPIMQDYCTVFPLKEGLRRFFDEKNDVMGYMDAACNIVIPARFYRAYNFSNGMARVMTKDGLWGFIDKSGNYAIEPMYSNEPSDFNYIAAMVTDKKGVNHIINKKGVIMFSNDKGMFGQMRPFVSKGDKAYAVWDYQGKGAVMDITLQPVVVHDLENLGELADFNDNWFLWSDCAVCSSKKWMIDWKGNELLFYWGTKFNEGLAVLNAEEYGVSGYINEYGEIVVRFVDTQF